MNRSPFHLTQLNIARMRAPLDDPIMAEFVAGLERVNSLAERSPGFVWRLQTEEGDATALRVFDDEMIIVNMSVWESIDALREFVYRSDHVKVLRQQAKWFEPMQEASLVMWWINAGDLPTVEEAKARLEHLREHGPTERAFSFRKPFDPPREPSVESALAQ